jgi:hypothetical protein
LIATHCLVNFAVAITSICYRGPEEDPYMADTPQYSDTGDEPDRGSTIGTPRWVKVFGIIALAVVVLFVVLKVTGLGGEHGPGRHTPGGDTPTGHTGPPPGVTHGEQQP